MGKLDNQKEENFCQEYIKDGNGKRAAIAAGYAKRSAEVTASKKLRITKVKNRIAELNKKSEEKSIMTAAKLKQWLSDLNNLDPMELYELNEDNEIVEKRLDRIKPEVRRLINNIYFQKIKVPGKKEGDKPTIITKLRFDIPNKQKVADMLARHFTLYNDKLVVEKLVSIKDMDKVDKSFDGEND
jgi:phage terminase small subunit